MYIGSILASVGLSLLVLSITRAFLRQRRLHRFFKNIGLKNPRPLPWIGNMLYILDSTTRVHYNPAKIYGKVYGWFLFSKPQFVIADPVIANRICIKEFDSFPNGLNLDFHNEVQKRFLFALKDDKWRRVRNMMSPTFSSGKIRRMYSKLEDCARDLALNLMENVDQDKLVIDLKSFFSFYTMDAITTCCYSLKLKRAGLESIDKAASRDELIRMANDSFYISKPRLYLFQFLPRSVSKWFNIQPCPMECIQPLVNRVKSMLEARKRSKIHYDDFLQSLIDSRDEDDNGNIKTDSSLTEEEIVSQAIMFLAAGLETTATLLTHCAYALAFHPEIQQKLSDLMRSLGHIDQETKTYRFEMETLMSCQYLEAVINETLRCTPVAQRVVRLSSRDFYVKEYDFTIPINHDVSIAISNMMTDSDYWEEPEIFNPNRFMPENARMIVPGSFQPFGLGPKQCIGKRFAMLEAKLCLATLVASYELNPAPGTKFPAELVSSLFPTKMKNPIVIVKRREL